MNLCREAELVVLAVSPGGGGARLQELLGSRLDWEFAVAFAEAHRLQQQFCCRLRALRPDVVSPHLEAAFQATLRSSLLLTRDLVNVLDLLAGAGVEALPFKGPALALEAYGSIAFRSFDDLDILVRKEDVWKTRDALMRADYKPKLDLNPAREADYLGAYDEYLLRGPGGTPLVELHWAFVPVQFGVTLGFSECWPNRREITLANRRIPSLDPADLLLVLSVHGAKHGWAWLGLIADVAWLVANHAMPWETLIERARTMGMLRMLLLAVQLVSEVFGVAAGAAMVKEIAADDEVTRLATEIIEAVFELNGRRHHDERSIVQSGRLHMRMRERRSDRLNYLARLATRPAVEDWQAIDLPAQLSFLYPILRPPRLLLKYLSRAR